MWSISLIQCLFLAHLGKQRSRGIFIVGNQNEFRDSSMYASIILLTDHTQQIIVDPVLLKNT